MKIEDGVLTKVDNEDIIDGKCIIPEGVTYIGDDAFSGCTGLTEINIPESVTEIGWSAFSGCIGLTEINIPESVTEIGWSAFSGCIGLTKIKIPKSVTYIGSGAFEGCIGLIEINIPEGATKIGESAFSGCTGLTEINIPEGVTGISNYAFSGCTGVTEINIPEVVTKIGESAFSGCTGLTEINIPEGVTYIGSGAFSGCTGLTEINIPEGVTVIGVSAFFGCTSLTEINIPEGVTAIGENAFGDTEVVLSKNISQNMKESLFGRNDINIKNYSAFESSLFGNDINRYNKLLDFSRGIYSADANYQDRQAQIFYSRIINCLGIEEFEKMLDTISVVPKEKLQGYIDQKDEVFESLYDTKYTIGGSLGVTLDILKKLNFSKYNSKAQNEKNTNEMKIFKELNALLDAGKGTNLKDLAFIAIEKAGIVLDEEEKENVEKIATEITANKTNEVIRRLETKVKSSLLQNISDSHIVEGQVDAITEMVNFALKDALRTNETLSHDDAIKLITEKLNQAHAPYVRQNAENIASRIANMLDSDDAKDILSTMPCNAIAKTRKDIKGPWRYNLQKAFESIGYSLDNIPNNLSYEEIEKLKEKLGNGLTIETKEVEVLKSDANLDEVLNVISDRDIPGIVTYKQIHDMFGSVHEPYSEEFRKYYKEHREEFLQNPEAIVKFGQIQMAFEELISGDLKRKYEKGTLEISDILKSFKEKKFANERKEDKELAEITTKVSSITNEEEFAHVQKVWDITRSRERTSLPPVSYQENSEFRGRMLSPNNVLNLFAGDLTSCCQRFKDVGDGSMMIAAIEENGGIFVVERQKDNGEYEIICQSLAIRQKGENGNYDRLCMDNIEINKDVLSSLSDNEHSQILRIYENAGEKALEMDEKFLRRQLEKGLIDEETFKAVVLKEVTAGTGYNDLKGLGQMPSAVPVAPDEAFYTYKGVSQNVTPWIDSAGGLEKKGSRGRPVIIAKRSAEDMQRLENTKKTKLNEVPLWYKASKEVRRDLTDEDVETIKKIERESYRKEQQILNNSNVKTLEDIASAYNSENKKIVIGSNEDWYLMYNESKKNVYIDNLAISGAINSQNSGTNTNVKHAILESTTAVYDLMLRAAGENKSISCNATKDTSLVNIKRMLKNDLAQIEDYDDRKIILNENGELIYEDNGEEVVFRKFSRNGNIDMLDLAITPNAERLKKENEKVKKMLGKLQEKASIEGAKKEEGLDELRSKIRSER